MNATDAAIPDGVAAALPRCAARQNAPAVPAQVKCGLVEAEASRQDDVDPALGDEAEVLAATARGSVGGIAAATTAKRSGGCLGARAHGPPQGPELPVTALIEMSPIGVHI
jgi:hypothetical protein